MKYEIIQICPYPDISFEMRRNGEIIGNIVRLPKKRQPYNYEINFLGKDIRMTMNTYLFTVDMLPWRKQKAISIFYFRTLKNLASCIIFIIKCWNCTGVLIQCGVLTLALRQKSLFGKESSKKTTGKQIALIETTSQNQELHHYQVTALEEKAGLIASLFCIYTINEQIQEKTKAERQRRRPE